MPEACSTICVYICVCLCVCGVGGGGRLKFRWMAVYTTSYLAANGAMAFMHPKIMMNSGTGRHLMASPLSSLERPPVKNLQHSQVKTKYAKKKEISMASGLMDVLNMLLASIFGVCIELDEG